MEDQTAPDYVDSVIVMDQPVEVTIDKYGKWHEYDECMIDNGYRGPLLAAEALQQLEIDEDARILDVGAGTGLLGVELHRLGYTNLVALEPSGLLKKARARRVYKDYIQDYVKKGHELRIDRESIDVAVAVGLMTPGHMYLDDIIELFPAMKPGGLICWTSLPPGYYADVEYRYTAHAWESAMEELVDGLIFKQHCEPITLENYYRGFDGLFYVIEVR